MPKGAQIIKVMAQYGFGQLWAIVNPEAPRETRYFETYGSSEEIQLRGLTYIDTYKIDDVIAHLFERGDHELERQST